MNNFISPNSHLSSFFTGSTIESMVKKAKELNTGYCVYTDNGYLTNTLKAYNLSKKEGLKFVAGCELYFADKDCDIIKGTNADRIRYYTITVHTKTQDAYQFLVKKISEKNRNKISILDQDYPLFNWQDLEDFASRGDITALIGGPQDIVCKNLLVKEPIVGAKIFKKLSEMFQENLYASIIPMEFDKKWTTSSVFTFTNGETVTLDSTIMAETQFARTFRVPLEEVAEKHAKHKSINKVYINGIGYKVNKDIVSACNLKDFKPIEVDIYKKYNDFVIMLSKKYGTKLIINDYSYFANKDDKLVQDLKLGDNHKLYTIYDMKSTEDVQEYFEKHYHIGFIEQLIKNSYEWAANFDNFELKYDYQMVREHEDHLQAAMELIQKIGRFDKNNTEHVKRLRHEIEVIFKNGKIDLGPYFFPISKVLNYYKERGRIIGPARGSAGGSFLMYCMGITELNPLKYNLSFARFLTLGRILSGSLPDVDCDLPNRDLLVSDGGFLDTYYQDRWAQISTRTIMKLKSSIRDVNRYKHGKVEDDIEKLAKSIEATPQGISDDFFVFGYEDSDGNHVPGLLEKDENLRRYTEERPEEWEIVKRTLGIARQNGRHASAFVITEKPIADIVPTMKISDSENVTQYEAKEVEEAGLIKYDFLVVKCLNDIELAIKYINEKTGVKELESGHFSHKGNDQYIWDLPEEECVFDMLSEGKTETIFQLNTVSVTPFVMKMRPKSVMDCAVITSLVRPGPLDFIDEKTGRNMAEEYLERVNGNSKGDISILDELIPETHGIFIFQEQISSVTKRMTGWDDEKAEDVRIAVGKKKLQMIMKLKPEFIDDSVSNGIDKDTATKVWGMIETFGRYGFNKCVSGDTVLLRNKNGSKPITIEEMYKAKNKLKWSKENGRESVGKKYRQVGYGKSYSKKDNTLHPNEIVDIRYEGKKDVYKTTTESGRTIKTTINHKFPTPKGEIMLFDLKVGDELYTNEGYKQDDTSHRFGGGNNFPLKGECGFRRKPNSSFVLYRDRSKILKENHKNCQLCGCDLIQQRVEIYHKDGDHGNQDWDNLLVCCVSCHKKEHYKMGRVKQGEKGLVCGVEKIISIEHVGTEDVYDIEMAAPYHNFVTDTGIVTCNSHATAYALIAYACAYLKYHYPLEWWAAVLSNADEKEITEVLWPHVRDILSPPDINLSNEEMVIDYNTNTIRNKLSVLRGLGEKVANKITELRPYKDIYDFADKKPVGHALTKKLIHVGVLDSLFEPSLNLMEKMQQYENAVEIIKYKEKITKKSENEIEWNQPLEDFIEKARINPKSRRCSHKIKEGVVDEKYIFINPVKDYILKKSIFPTMPMPLYDIIRENSVNVKILNTANASFAVSKLGREIRLINGKTYQNIKNLDYKPGSTQVIDFAIAAYVIESSEFSYKNGERKALKIVIDIDGFLEELVIWPDYESGILDYPDNLKKNAVIYLFMYRKMSKELYHTNISDVIVEDIFCD